MQQQRDFVRSGALALLLFICLVLSACGSQPAAESGGESTGDQAQSTGEQAAGATAPESGGETTVRAVTPDQVLSEEERTGVPKFDGWDSTTGDVPVIQATADSSVGAIPAVQPFNFGRDPGGPEDKTLYVTVPKIGLEDVPVYDSVSEDKLKDSAVHVPATGFPWQNGSNTYIAGHRIGYAGTGSYRVFYDLDQVVEGDEITLRDADGAEYVYRVTKNVVVGPENVQIMNPEAGKSIVSLQTCTLPDYAERIVVQGELVEQSDS